MVYFEKMALEQLFWACFLCRLYVAIYIFDCCGLKNDGIGHVIISSYSSGSGSQVPLVLTHSNAIFIHFFSLKQQWLINQNSALKGSSE